MAITRSMTRNQNHGASNRKRFKTCDNGGPSSWSDLNRDLLYVVMMQLGVIDFIAFSGVCKSWRSFAFLNRQKFMTSRQPLSISIYTYDNEEECCLHDFEGRNFYTILPHSRGMTCVGLTCGYLIMFGVGTHDILLVNPITRHELHFPRYPFQAGTEPETLFRGILVFSPSISKWVLVCSIRYSEKILFCLAGEVEEASWNVVPNNFFMWDIHAFKGKIYIMNSNGSMCEMKFKPKPTLELVKLSSSRIPLTSDVIDLEFVSSSENLYVMDRMSGNVYKSVELDLGEMKWVNSKRTIGEYAIFYGNLKCTAAIQPDTWADPWTLYKKGKSFFSNMWYFPVAPLSL